MQTNTIYFPDVDSSSSASYYMTELQIKGNATLTFVLTAFDTSVRDIIQVVAVFGDGDTQTYNVDITQSTFALPISTVSHNYYSQYSTYSTRLSAVFQVVYTNLAVINYVQPLHILQGSYYDEIGDLHVASTQLVPVSSNDALVTCFDDFSNLHNLVLHKTLH